MENQAVIDRTRRWIAAMVIELDLCPFARRVFQENKIRYQVSTAENEQTLLGDLNAELEALAKTPVAITETTLLIHPRALANFLEYNDFLDDAEQCVHDLGLRGVLQIASFHPDYQFAGTESGAVENYTNRSPYPMLHLLREESIAAVAGAPNQLLDIPRRNIEILKRLGREKVLERLRAIAIDG